MVTRYPLVSHSLSLSLSACSRTGIAAGPLDRKVRVCNACIHAGSGGSRLGVLQTEASEEHLNTVPLPPPETPTRHLDTAPRPPGLASPPPGRLSMEALASVERESRHDLFARTLRALNTGPDPTLTPFQPPKGGPHSPPVSVGTPPREEGAEEGGRGGAEEGAREEGALAEGARAEGLGITRAETALRGGLKHATVPSGSASLVSRVFGAGGPPSLVPSPSFDPLSGGGPFLIERVTIEPAGGTPKAAAYKRQPSSELATPRVSRRVSRGAWRSREVLEEVVTMTCRACREQAGPEPTPSAPCSSTEPTPSAGIIEEPPVEQPEALDSKTEGDSARRAVEGSHPVELPESAGRSLSRSTPSTPSTPSHCRNPLYGPDASPDVKSLNSGTSGAYGPDASPDVKSLNSGTSGAYGPDASPDGGGAQEGDGDFFHTPPPIPSSLESSNESSLSRALDSPGMPCMPCMPCEHYGYYHR